MKIPLSKLLNDLEISISGEEDWLKEIYDSCESAPPEQVNFTRLSGKLKITVDSLSENYQVSGQFEYKPLVSCTLCLDPIPWDLSSVFSVRVLPGAEEEQIPDFENIDGEGTYLVRKDSEIDLGIILNDIIQEGLPERLFKESKDGETCFYCDKKVDATGLVYGHPETATKKPLAALGEMFRNKK